MVAEFILSYKLYFSIPLLLKSLKTESKITLQGKLNYVGQRNDAFTQCSFGERLEFKFEGESKLHFKIQLCQNLINSWHDISSLLLFSLNRFNNLNSSYTVFLPQEEAFPWHCEPFLIARLNLRYRARQAACTEEPLTFIFMNSNISARLAERNLVRRVCAERHFAG